MKIWYLLVNIENDNYKIVMEDGINLSGEPVTEPKFFETIEEAREEAENLELEDYEIYEKVL
jgi:hypothetical protein